MRRSNARSQAPDPDLPSEMEAPPKTLLRRIPPLNRKHQVRSRWIPVVSTTAFTFLLYLFFVSRSSDSVEYAIVIDGGSTGSRIHVFGYRNGRGGMPELESKLTSSMKVSPGLSSYSGDPVGAGESLMELMEFGKREVPEERWGETEVRLMATAGLRLLDTGTVERILESCRVVLRSSEFRFQDDWATVISGSDEGIYAWVAANYALGALGGDPEETTGIFELGGASAQVAFVSTEQLPQEFSHVINFGKAAYNLYSHSFLHLGQNVAYQSFRELLISGGLRAYDKSVREGTFSDPCTPRGYLHRVESIKPSSSFLNFKAGYHSVSQAVGNFTECRSAALMLLQKGKDKCLYPHCHIGSAFIPKLRGRFLATENFYYTTKFFGLGPTSILYDLMLAGEQFCGEDWLALKKKYHALEEEDLVQYCFSSSYIVALLHDSLGVAVDDKRIEFAHQVGDVPLDWALGAFILQKASNQRFYMSDWIIAIVSGDSSALLSLSIICSLLIFAVWSLSKWWKPQLKTIYDLEKGRYITTRISR